MAPTTPRAKTQPLWATAKPPEEAKLAPVQKLRGLPVQKAGRLHVHKVPRLRVQKVAGLPVQKPHGHNIKDLTRPTYSSGSKFLTIDGDATIEFGPGIYGFDLSSWMNVQPKNSEALSFSDLHSCAGKNDPEWGGVTKVGDDHVRRVSTYEIPADSVEIFLKDPYTGNQIAWKLQ